MVILQSWIVTFPIEFAARNAFIPFWSHIEMLQSPITATYVVGRRLNVQLSAMTLSSAVRLRTFDGYSENEKFVSVSYGDRISCFICVNDCTYFVQYNLLPLSILLSHVTSWYEIANNIEKELNTHRFFNATE